MLLFFIFLVEHLPLEAMKILKSRSLDAARGWYRKVENMPKANTKLQFQKSGWTFAEMSARGEGYSCCFRDGRPYLARPATLEEVTRVGALLKSVSKSSYQLNEHIVPIILEKHEGTRHYFISPLYPITLDTYPSLEEASSQRLWSELSQALKSLHQFGYAHMDIKAANICVTTEGKFILIDLGSVAKFHTVTETTEGVLPVGLTVNTADPSVDWWMLAAVVSEYCSKRVSSNPLRFGTGETNPTLDDIESKR